VSGWRHVEQVTQHAGTRVCGNCYVENKVCTTPTPDPASPCGWTYGNGEPCDVPADRLIHPASTRPFYGLNTHDFVPTRCTCGHPIERVR
jgi:hypothetical protein